MTNISIKPLLEIDGRRLYYTFIAGAKKIIENQAELNRINVFPVNDGDTGTNMASTIRSVIDTLIPQRSYKIIADKIAEATLSNARGNSGIIFAQFLYGMSNETGDLKSVNLIQFAEIVRKSVRYIYEAVAVPVEGTMLTVIKAWADFIYTFHNSFQDFNSLLIGSFEVIQKALLETTSKLQVLAKAKVVDAGAKGFVLFVQGIIELIGSNDIKLLLNSKTDVIEFEKHPEIICEHIGKRYCTEAVLKDSAADSKTLTKLLLEFGDSVVVAGHEKLRRLHLHTDNPSALFFRLKDFGILTFQKADDMARQSDTVYRRKWDIGLVIDSTCDIPVDLAEYYQIHTVPINIHFGENHYLDKVTLAPEQFYNILYKSKDFPTTSQANEKTFINLYSHLATYYNSVIAVHLTDKFSGTFFNSEKAAETISRETGKKISVINSKTVSGAAGLVILRIAMAIENGLTHEQILSETAKWIENTKIFVSVKTLKYMVRGGRVSKLKGILANILNIKPIVSVDSHGNSLIFGKAFSQKSNMHKVMRHIRKISRGRKIWKYMVLHANNESAADWYTHEMTSLTLMEPVSVLNISPVVGINAGIGTASVALMFE